jgi:DNA-binding NtrC family response regulator
VNTFIEDLGRFQTANEKMLAAVASARRVAPSICPVLILGEEGSGRREMALEIYEKSGSKRGPFIRYRSSEFSLENLNSMATVLVENVEALGHQEQF